jgi:hypothetical protein
MDEKILAEALVPRIGTLIVRAPEEGSFLPASQKSKQLSYLGGKS